MSVKNVVLAQRNGNGVDVVLPRTSADLTGYENADAPGVETVAEALDDIYARSPGNIAALAGRVDVLETGQVEQNEDIAALESGVADWTASKPGIVQRGEVLEAKPDPTPESIGALAVDGKAAGAVTADNATNAVNAANASTLKQGGTGSAMTFHWSGQPGQPSWLWGSNDGLNSRVWNPANFRVAFATNATHAGTADKVANCNCACQCDGGY